MTAGSTLPYLQGREQRQVDTVAGDHNHWVYGKHPP